jgi:hypothetical protein
MKLTKGQIAVAKDGNHPFYHGELITLQRNSNEDTMFYLFHNGKQSYLLTREQFILVTLQS